MTSCVVDKIIYSIKRETCRKTRTFLYLLYMISGTYMLHHRPLCKGGGGGGQTDRKEKNPINPSSLAKGFCARIRNPCLVKLKQIKPYSANIPLGGGGVVSVVPKIPFQYMLFHYKCLLAAIM